MTTYIVLKRSKGDGWMPKDVIVDPIRADLLVQRGYIQEVPDNFQEKVPDATAKAEKLKAKVDKIEEKDLTKEGEAALLEARPEAKELAKAMDAKLDEVFALSDEDYKAGVEAFLTNSDEGDKGTGGSGSDALPPVVDLTKAQ